MKKLFVFVAFAACMMLLAPQTTPVFAMPEMAAGGETVQIIVPPSTSSDEWDESETQQEALEEAEKIAYLDLESASPEMKEKILSARNQIIFSQTWVADGFCAYVTDSEDTVIAVVPCFSELFPDWDIPVDESIANGDFDMSSIPYFDGHKWMLPDGEIIPLIAK